MKEFWTGDLIGKMHNYEVSRQEIADVLGVTEAYLSMILNGRYAPKDARAKLEGAFHEVLRRRKEESN